MILLRVLLRHQDFKIAKKECKNTFSAVREIAAELQAFHKQPTCSVAAVSLPD